MSLRIIPVLLISGTILAPVPLFAADPSVAVSVKSSEPAPTCKAHAVRTKIESGSATTIYWRSKHADHMIGLTKGTEYPARGHEKIAIGFPGVHTFALIFIGEGGMKACTVTVNVRAKQK